MPVLSDKNKKTLLTKNYMINNKKMAKNLNFC